MTLFENKTYATEIANASEEVSCERENEKQKSNEHLKRRAQQ